MVITEDEGAGALDLLHVCLNLVPDESWVWEPVGKALKGGTSEFNGKTIIFKDVDAGKGLLNHLLQQIELSVEVGQSKRRSAIEHPASFVAITKNPNHQILNDRYVNRIHVNADSESKKGRLQSLISKPDSKSQQQSKIECACVRTLLARAKDHQVDIDFAEQIIDQEGIQYQNVVPFVHSMFRVIKNITRINNSPPLHPQEPLAAFLGLDLEDLIEDGSSADRVLNATKVDYKCFLMIFGGLLKVNNDFLTPRQSAILIAILTQNIDHVKGHYKHKKSSIQQMLDDYSDGGFNKGWATREDIEGKLTDQTEKFSYATLHKELQILLKYNLIKMTKVPRKTNKYAYVATRPLEDASIFKTDCKQITDPHSKSKTIDFYDFWENKVIKI
jgi:hypothetical protein